MRARHAALALALVLAALAPGARAHARLGLPAHAARRLALPPARRPRLGARVTADGVPPPPGPPTAPPSAAKRAWPPWLDPADRRRMRERMRLGQTAGTIGRVIVPSIVCAILGVLYFDNISNLVMKSLDAGGLVMVMQDESQFIQNFLTVIGLLFSILAGNAYSSLYTQQETIYFALFNEVSEAKSLLEQATLVCQGRPFYPAVLAQFEKYVSQDLRRLDLPPAALLSARPAEDPLESIMYMTSVGVPSVIYETVKSLRQARGYRLGACQRKFPTLGIALLYVLAALELVAFPLLGAGTATVSNRVLNLQSSLFGLLCGALVMVLRVIQELRLSSGGVFTVDLVLRQMVSGLEIELEQRRRAAAMPPGGTLVPPPTAAPAAPGVPAPPVAAPLPVPQPARAGSTRAGSTSDMGADRDAWLPYTPPPDKPPPPPPPPRGGESELGAQEPPADGWGGVRMGGAARAPAAQAAAAAAAADERAAAARAAEQPPLEHWQRVFDDDLAGPLSAAAKRDQLLAEAELEAEQELIRTASSPWAAVQAFAITAIAAWLQRPS